MPKSVKARSHTKRGSSVKIKSRKGVARKSGGGHTKKRRANFRTRSGSRSSLRVGGGPKKKTSKPSKPNKPAQTDDDILNEALAIAEAERAAATAADIATGRDMVVALQHMLDAGVALYREESAATSGSKTRTTENKLLLKNKATASIATLINNHANTRDEFSTLAILAICVQTIIGVIGNIGVSTVDEINQIAQISVTRLQEHVDPARHNLDMTQMTDRYNDALRIGTEFLNRNNENIHINASFIDEIIIDAINAVRSTPGTSHNAVIRLTDTINCIFPPPSPPRSPTSASAPASAEEYDINETRDSTADQEYRMYVMTLKTILLSVLSISTLDRGINSNPTILLPHIDNAVTALTQYLNIYSAENASTLTSNSLTTGVFETIQFINNIIQNPNYAVTISRENGWGIPIIEHIFAAYLTKTQGVNINMQLINKLKEFSKIAINRVRTDTPITKTEETENKKEPDEEPEEDIEPEPVFATLDTTNIAIHGRPANENFGQNYAYLPNTHRTRIDADFAQNYAYAPPPPPAQFRRAQDESLPDIRSREPSTDSDEEFYLAR
jgi:hypothetical protein